MKIRLLSFVSAAVALTATVRAGSLEPLRFLLGPLHVPLWRFNEQGKIARWKWKSGNQSVVV